MNKAKNLKFICFIVCMVILGAICFFIMFNNNVKMAENEKRNINVSGFDMEYAPPNRRLNISDFEKIELGYSYDEIENILGEADGWIGGGILRPVYILEDGTAVVCYFSDPEREKDLKELEWFNEKGEGKIIRKVAQ